MTSRASRVGNGGTRSCSSSIWSRYSGLRMSTRVLSACRRQCKLHVSSATRHETACGPGSTNQAMTVQHQ